MMCSAYTRFPPVLYFKVQCCFTSTATVRTSADGTATSTFTLLLSYDILKSITFHMTGSERRGQPTKSKVLLIFVRKWFDYTKAEIQPLPAQVL